MIWVHGLPHTNINYVNVLHLPTENCFLYRRNRSTSNSLHVSTYKQPYLAIQQWTKQAN